MFGKSQKQTHSPLRLIMQYSLSPKYNSELQSFSFHIMVALQSLHFSSSQPSPPSSSLCSSDSKSAFQVQSTHPPLTIHHHPDLSPAYRVLCRSASHQTLLRKCFSPQQVSPPPAYHPPPTKTTSTWKAQRGTRGATRVSGT